MELNAHLRYTMTTLQQLNEYIHLTEIRFPDYIVRGGLLLGEETAVVWDSLSHPGDMLALLPLIAGRQVTVIYSHADWDHIWGTAALAGDRLTVIGHRRCRQRFDEDVPLTLRERRLAEPGLWEAVRLVPPDVVFDREYRLDLGEFSLELRALPGHTPDSVVGLVPEYGLLFMGDTVETPLPCLPPGCPLQEWLVELEHWRHDPRVRIVIPAHGPWGGREIISRTIAYLQDLAAGRKRLDRRWPESFLPADPPGKSPQLRLIYQLDGIPTLTERAGCWYPAAHFQPSAEGAVMAGIFPESINRLPLAERFAYGGYTYL